MKTTLPLDLSFATAAAAATDPVFAAVDEAPEIEFDPNAVDPDDFIPPGYRLTYAAKLRLQALADAPNRTARRFLLSKFEKAPIATFELIPSQ